MSGSAAAGTRPPGAGIIDSQSVKATDRGGLHGHDGGKKAGGIKRHLLVDTLGTVLTACAAPPVSTTAMARWHC